MLKHIEKLTEYSIRVCDVCEDEHITGSCSYCSKDFCKKHRDLVWYNDLSANVCPTCKTIVDKELAQYEKVMERLYALKEKRDTLSRKIEQKIYKELNEKT